MNTSQQSMYEAFDRASVSAMHGAYTELVIELITMIRELMIEPVSKLADGLIDMGVDY